MHLLIISYNRIPYLVEVMHTHVRNTYMQKGTLSHLSYLPLCTEFVQLHLQILYDAAQRNYTFHTDLIANKGYSKMPSKRLKSLWKIMCFVTHRIILFENQDKRAFSKRI